MSKPGIYGIVGALLLMQGVLSGAMWIYKFNCIEVLWTMLLIDGIIINIVGGVFLVCAIFSKFDESDKPDTKDESPQTTEDT
jgi:hypothetical protein